MINHLFHFKKKIDAISSAYFKEKEETIAAYFHNCGILHLLNEGLFPKSKFQVIHNPLELLLF